jgi:hypothetical protein
MEKTGSSHGVNSKKPGRRFIMNLKMVFLNKITYDGSLIFIQIIDFHEEIISIAIRHS